ncbi:Nucleotide exchange factor SIL1 [Schistosoma japonicum]|nr:Nucleotide exchange factor SIL1 [Schistosoma japonicum]KAH8868106.1 Nucleotide exchange factor SIL1 [Schistosoma japonicum]
MEDFQKINMNVKTDVEIMSELVMEIKQGNSTVERLLILLEDLSYYLHQIDNSKVFSESGFDLLTYHLRHPSYEVVKAALKAIGAATQGNSDVKVVALQGGVLDHLHSILKASINKQNSSKFSTLLLSGVSALSSLLRDFPSAQKQFFSASGLSPTGFELLAQLSHLNTLDANRDLRVRILTFLTDLYSERLGALSAFEKDPVDAKKYIWNLYASIPFEEKFLMHGFCETLRSSLLQDVQEGIEGNDLSIPTNHDIREKVITACLKFFNLCDWASLDYSNKQHIQSLLDSLIREYKLRSRSETNDIDSYFTDMLLKAQKLRSMVASNGFPKSDL